MQQTLSGCAFCDSPPGAEMGEAHTWGKDERVTHPICVDCAIQSEPDPDERDAVLTGARYTGREISNHTLSSNRSTRWSVPRRPFK
jgi:hypothetical protein